MSDYSIKDLKLQGRKARVVYGYKATMNDELNLKIDDTVVLTQCSEDETWLEGTLNGLTGWFPSNYVQIIEEDLNEESITTCKSDILSANELINSNFKHQPKSEFLVEQKPIEDQNLRIKYINELKQVEEAFLDEMCKFVKTALLPLQSTGEIFPIIFIQQMNTCLDDVIRCHQAFYQQLKEVPENSDAKVGNLLIAMAPQFKHVYESYAKNNPKFIYSINKKKEVLSKFFESSLSKMSSPLVPITSSITVPIYLSKFLATPFKQLEVYLKLLKEIQRHTEDYHIDRGDLQRSLEFYTDLFRDVNEIRKRKEYEMDILSSKINNCIDNEDLFKNGSEIHFLSPVLIINESGEKKECILAMFQNCVIALTSSSKSASQEFNFEYKIPFSSLNHHTTKMQLIQVKKVNISINLEEINSTYGNGIINWQSLLTKYMFEIIGAGKSIKSNSASDSIDRLLIVCSTSYDLKMWLDLLNHFLTKINSNNSSSSSLNGSKTQPKQNSYKANQTTTTTTPKHQLSNIDNQSPKTNNNAPNRKHLFSIRPHPALIPHFQLPGDSNPQQFHSPMDTTSTTGTATLKRFMYKKAKLSEPFGKYHGADDDLKLLTVIESFCKTKLRHSVNLNDTSVNAQQLQTINKNHQNACPAKKMPSEFTSPLNEISISPSNSVQLIANDKCINKYLKKLMEDKMRLESSIQSISVELNDTKNLNKELKTICSSLSKQLENERATRRKMESYIRKQFKLTTNTQNYQSSNETNNTMNIEHESSI